MKSKLIARENEQKKQREILKFNDDEKKQVNLIFSRLLQSWEDQNKPMDEFDGKSLLQQLSECRLMANSFIAPISNDGEVRVVTGTLEGKIDTVFNSVFNQYTEAEIRSFSENDIEDIDLGEKLTKINLRTEQIERAEDFYESALKELLTMPAVFAQETLEDEWYYDRQLESGEWEDLWNLVIPKFKKVKWYRKREARKVLWTADQVFLSDYRIPARLFHTQPYIITYKTRSYEGAEKIYGKSPRWKYVQGGKAVQEQSKGSIETSEWRFSKKINNTEVEEIIYKSVQDDEYQIILNGVPMLPTGCPFFVSNKFKTYDMIMSVMKEIHPKFAYGRSLVMMGKTLQALKDENFRLLILKYRQSIWKPIVTKSQTILNKDMWLPSSITYGIDRDEIQELVDGNLNNGDFGMNDMVESEIEKFINVSSTMQGNDTGRQQTAHEVAIKMKQSLINLGHSLTSYLKLKRDLTYLRLNTIVSELTKPIDIKYNDFNEKNENIYKAFTLNEMDLFDGTLGTEIISFIDRQLLPQEVNLILDKTDEMKQMGRPTNYSFININKLRKIPYLFYINIVPKEKRTSMIERELRKNDLIESVQFGQQLGVPLNQEYAIQEWGKRSDVDTQKLFQVQNQDLLQMMQQNSQGMQGMQGTQGTQGMQINKKDNIGKDMMTGAMSVNNPEVKQ